MLQRRQRGGFAMHQPLGRLALDDYPLGRRRGKAFQQLSRQTLARLPALKAHHAPRDLVTLNQTRLGLLDLGMLRIPTLEPKPSNIGCAVEMAIHHVEATRARG